MNYMGVVPAVEGGRVERKKKIKLADGSEADAVELGYRSEGEYFNEYLLDDGTVLRQKVVVTEVVRVDDRWDDDGNPIYLLKANPVTVVSVPDHLKKKD